MRLRLAYVLATWFGCGRVPYAPGTAGTLGALPLFFALRPWGSTAVLSAAIATAAIGVWAASVVAHDRAAKDPQLVVIDEVAGVLVSLTASSSAWWSIVVAVVAFRIFDQWKPWPARQLEAGLPSGWGIVLDDLAAGIWGAVVVVVVTAAIRP